MTAPYYDQDGITIYHGDCLEVLPRIAADVMITDPDYGVGIDFTRLESTTGANVGRSGSLRPHEADALVTSTLRSARLAQPLAVMFWSGSWQRIRDFDAAVERASWRVHHIGIWYKPNGAGPSGNGLARRFEPWFWLTTGERAPRAGEWNALPDCINVPRVVPGQVEAVRHPTQKPVELMRRLVRFFTQPGDLIVDPFMGSGTTLRAAKDLGRRAIGIEVNEAYCEMAARRMAQGVLAFEAEAAAGGA